MTLGRRRPAADQNALVVVGLFGLALIAFAAFLSYREVSYAVDGAQAIGRVTDMTIELPGPGGKGATTHYAVAYTFPPADSDQRISGDGDVEKDEWDALTVGGPIEVEYQRADPAGANRPFGKTDLGVVPMIAGVGALFELGYLRAIWLARRRRSRPDAG
jgi:hypothetical protein